MDTIHNTERREKFAKRAAFWLNVIRIILEAARIVRLLAEVF